MRLKTLPDTYASKIFDTACAAGLIKATNIPSKFMLATTFSAFVVFLIIPGQ